VSDPSCSQSAIPQTTAQCDEAAPAAEDIDYDPAVVSSVLRAARGHLVEFDSIEAACSYLGLDDLHPASSVTAEHGYWITRDGEVLSVDREGHIAVLMDRDEFIDLSPTQPYADWYTAALDRFWVRVVAPAGDRRQFRFQYVKLTSATRSELIRLIVGLELYGQYIFEAATYLTFASREETVRFVEHYDEAVAEMATDT